MINHDVVFPIPALKDNYIWAIISKNFHAALIIDPGESAPVQALLQKHSCVLKAILLTHHHGDHTHGVAALSKEWGCPVFGPAREKIQGVTQAVKEADVIQLADFPLALQVMDIPGHTLGHIAYYTHNMLFCGDTLFAAGCGRLFEGSAEQMLASLEKLAALPNETRIYCAHEYTLANLHFAQQVEPSNLLITKRIQQVSLSRKKNLPSLPSILREEKATNPFLRCHAPEVIKSVEHYSGKQLPDKVSVFRELRRWKDGFN